MELWRIKISGTVQGVCFRNYICRFVGGTVPEVKGYVKNCYDGSVEVLGYGEPNDLLKLEQACRQGPPASKVQDVIIQKDDDIENIKNSIGDTFKISYE